MRTLSEIADEAEDIFVGETLSQDPPIRLLVEEIPERNDEEHTVVSAPRELYDDLIFQEEVEVADNDRTILSEDMSIFVDDSIVIGEEGVEVKGAGEATVITDNQSRSTIQVNSASPDTPVKPADMNDLQPSATLDTQDSFGSPGVTEGAYDEEGGQEIVYSGPGKWVFRTEPKKRRHLIFWAAAAIFLLLLAIFLGVFLSNKGGKSGANLNAQQNSNNDNSETSPTLAPVAPPPTFVPTLAPTTAPPTLAPVPAPTISPTLAPVLPTLSPRQDQLLNIVAPISGYALGDPSSPQSRAYDMLLNEETGDDDDDITKTIQRYITMTLVMSLVVGEGPSQFISVDDECTWDFIVCSDGGNVTQIRMANMGLTGSVPPEVGFFHDLTLLDLSKNFIQGAIPENIFAMQKLEQLYLYDNRLTGSLVVGGVGSMLNTLNLANNELTGSIPENLPSGLRFISFYKNQFTGSIPPSLVANNSLVYVDLSFNSLTGELPIASTTSLRHLYLSHNSLTGQVPQSYATDMLLVTFYIDHNLFDGGVPTGFSQDQLQTLQLQSNNFEEELDQDVCDLDIMSLGVVIDLIADCSICTCTNRLCDECIVGRI